MSGVRRDHSRQLIIRPKIPSIPWIFDLPPETTIASHAPHDHIEEHLHDHFFHMHIRYGFEFPAQTLPGIDETSLEVVMMIKAEHRVDCNPVFVARREGPEGVCLKLAGQDVHWVHNEETADKYTKLYRESGRDVPEGYYFSGFRTSDTEERNVWRYSRETLLAAIGRGLRADQHFQATWREPRDQPIEPYDVVIGLGDEVSSYYTFFRLPVVVPIGVW